MARTNYIEPETLLNVICSRHDIAETLLNVICSRHDIAETLLNVICSRHDIADTLHLNIYNQLHSLPFLP
jgi:hypothetical protein